MSDDEDINDIQDWKVLTQDVVPKRGEKDFAPDGTEVQSQLLQDSRNAMYTALSVRRGHTIKQELVGIWYPQRNEAFVPHLKGPYFKDIGRTKSSSADSVRGTWMSPVETVYLCERGSIRIFLHNDTYEQYQLRLVEKENQREDQKEASVDTPDEEFDYSANLISLSLGHLYALAFSHDSTLVGKYQVYSYLKRLGYLVMDFQDRTDKQVEEYKELVSNKPQQSRLVLQIVQAYVESLFSFNVPNILLPKRHFFDYKSIFAALRIVPSYSTFDSLKNVGKEVPKEKTMTPSFDVWKPTPQFSKKNPPQPDFQIAVMNTNQSSFPTLPKIQELFNASNHRLTATSAKKDPTAVKTSSSGPSKREVRAQRAKERYLKLDPKIQRSIDYNKLRDKKFKYGSSGRCFVIALIDNGVVNFVNLGEGDFSLSGFGNDDLQALLVDSNQDHGIVW